MILCKNKLQRVPHYKKDTEELSSRRGQIRCLHEGARFIQLTQEKHLQVHSKRTKGKSSCNKKGKFQLNIRKKKIMTIAKHLYRQCRFSISEVSQNSTGKGCVHLEADSAWNSRLDQMVSRGPLQPDFFFVAIISNLRERMKNTANSEQHIKNTLIFYMNGHLNL